MSAEAPQRQEGCGAGGQLVAGAPVSFLLHRGPQGRITSSL